MYPCGPDDQSVESQPSWQVTRTNGYVHAPSHKSDEPSFYDMDK